MLDTEMRGRRHSSAAAQMLEIGEISPTFLGPKDRVKHGVIQRHSSKERPRSTASRARQISLMILNATPHSLKPMVKSLGIPGTIVVLLAALAACLISFALWLRPELVGYQVLNSLFNPDCFVWIPVFHGGNANRIVALYNAIHIAQHRKFRYIAVSGEWQKWLCKLYDADTILGWPVPVVPTDTSDIGCSVFQKPELVAIRNPSIDTCDYWHQSNFYRLSWYQTGNINFDFDAWKFLMPTGVDRKSGHTYRSIGEARIVSARTQAPNGKVITVHKRWLDRWCSAQIDYAKLHTFSILEQYCHLLPQKVKAVLSVEADIQDVDQYKVLVSSDGYQPQEESVFSWEFETEETPFIGLFWTWVLSDVHFGHPNSTIDQMACRFRHILCVEESVSEKNSCMPCFPMYLEKSIAGEYQGKYKGYKGV